MKQAKYKKPFIILSLLKNQVNLIIYMNDFWLDSPELDEMYSLVWGTCFGMLKWERIYNFYLRVTRVNMVGLAAYMLLLSYDLD